MSGEAAAGASAPGKMMLGGEYAVLDGAPAIVAAVQRRVSVRLDATAPPSTPEVEACLELASARGLARPCGVIFDTHELQRDGQKLGFGSSAAKAAAASAAAYSLAGQDPTSPDVVKSILDIALEGHRAVAPNGSGADVAASVLGGVIRFTRGAAGVEAEPLDWPLGLEVRVLFTGASASTEDLIQQVRALGERAPALLEARLGALSEEANYFAASFESRSAADIVDAAARYGRCMAALGEACDAPIVDERLAKISALAEEAGGSAKPSGAGGGDIAVAFFAKREDAKRFEALVEGEEMEILDVSLGGPGVLPLPA